MKITRLELVGYKRLLLNNIQRFEITPTSPYQILLGTNGSGKSSVLEELTPLPAIPANYAKGGSKTIELEHRGHEYVLTSAFKSSNHHSFTKDGKELNDGGTGQVQKTLCEQEFGLTVGLRDILIDETTFTDMGPQQRREWITRLSGGDLDYAIKIFGEIKTKLRDTQGAVKHVKNRLVVETEKLTPEEEFQKIKDQAEHLKGELTAMMNAYNSNVRRPDAVEAELQDRLHQLHQLSQGLLSRDCTKPKIARERGVRDMETLQNLRAALNEDYAAEAAMKRRCQEEFQELGELMQTLEDAGTEGVEALRGKVDSIEKRRVELQQEIREFFIEEEPDLVRESTTQAVPLAINVFLALPDNSEKIYTRDKLQSAKEKIRTHQDRLDRLRHYRNQGLEKLDHIKNAKETGCPSCGYVFIPGVSDRDKAVIEQKLQKAGEEIEKTQAALEEQQKYVEECEEYSELYRKFKNLVNTYPRMQRLWDYILDNRMSIDDPKNKVHVFETWQTDVEVSCEIYECVRQLREYRDALAHLDKLGQGGSHFQNRVEKLREDMNYHTDRLATLGEQSKSLSTYIAEVEAAGEEHNTILSYQESIGEILDELVKGRKNQLLDNCIGEHQTQLAALQNEIAHRRSAEELVGDIRKQYEGLSEDKETLDILMKELSPTDGFIAEQLMGFIEGLIGEMNKIIASIWTYDMEVEPCGVESDELDYKFPLIVRGSELKPPDVKKGSSSQIDVVDFSFKLIVMLFLGVQDYPIYLDELAPSLDEQHRTNIMTFVKQLVETHRCSQMFMVSHYQAGHGSFTSAEYCVMDAANVTTPAEFNKHVVME